MRRVAIIFAAALGVGAATAQQPAAAGGAPMMKLFSSAADIQELIAKAKRDRKGDQPTVSEPILRLAPYNANLEYRAAVGPAAVHETEAEIFYVIEGSGTMTTGGKLIDEKRTNAENLTGTGIEGGSSRTLTKGDFLVVPEKTPHWVSAIDGSIVLMTLHVPRPAPAR